jgi:multidrug efflux pump subunit AcrA (membrane-fusion protein)
MKRLLPSLCLLFAALPTGAETLSGRLAWVAPLELSTTRSGVVREVPVASGDRVATGALLARLEMRDARAHLSAAQAALKAAGLARDEALRERDRTRELYDRTLLSDHDLQLAEIALIEAESAWRKAQAAQADAELDVEYSELRAPYPALVLEVKVQPGQTVVNRVSLTPMISVTRSDSMAVRAPATAQQAVRVAARQSLRVRVADTELDGVVTAPGLVADRDGDDPQYFIEVRFGLPQGSQWRAGQPAEILLP